MRATGRLTGFLVAALAAALLGPAAAPGAPQVNGIFPLSGSPGQLTEGPDGNIWVALNDSSAGNDLARITPDGTVTEFNPADLQFPVGITSGPDGNLWLTQTSEVVRVPPADPGSAQKFAVAALADPRGIVTGPDGNLWAASGEKLVKIPPADPTSFDSTDVAGMSARGIDAGGGRLRIADFGSGRVISATTAGVTTPVEVGGGPQDVAAGPGDQVAYSNPGDAPQTVGRLEPGGSPLLTETPLADPFGIDLGPDGAYWIAQFAAGTLGRLSPQGDYTTLGGLPAASGPRQLSAGPNETVWVSLETSNQIARVTGVEPPDPTPTPDPTLDGSASAKKLQKQKGNRIAVKVKVKAKEELEAKASGKIKVRKKSYKLKPKTESVSEGDEKTLKLRPKNNKQGKKIAKALKKGNKAQAKLTVKLSDQAGNKKTKKLKVKLKR